MFERFTTDTRDVVIRARSHARRLRDHWIDTPHLLLALTGAGSANAAALAGLGLTQDAVEQAVADLPRLARRPPAGPAPAPDPVEDAQALAAFGIDVHRIREAVEAGFGPGALDRGPDPSSRSRSWLVRRMLARLDPRVEGQQAAGAATRGGRIPFTADARTTLELALREALRLQDRELREEHLTLGLLRCADDRTRAVLHQLGVDPAAVRRTVEAQTRRTA